MKAIKFTDVVKENGLILNSPELMMLFNREVEIIVLEKETDIIEVADSKGQGKQFNKDDINAMSEALREMVGRQNKEYQ